MKTPVKVLAIGIADYFLFLIVCLLPIILSCNSPTQPPPPVSGLITLSLTDVSCTEAWIELKTNGVTSPVNVNLLANNSLIAQLNNLSHSDTTIYIDSLLPNKSYQFQAQFNQGLSTLSSNKLAVQTLDTTSNNYTWQTYTFGDPNAGSSHLSDLAIIDENNIWAVGEIYADDSTGQPDPLLYNAVHWDGSNWKLKRIYFTNSNNQTFLAAYTTILAFNNSDIWFATDQLSHWDGQKYLSVEISASIFNTYINKIWGSADNDLYVVGNSGSIAHYNGSTWQKIESGTTTDINDIWGINNALVGNTLILATVSSRYELGDYKLLSISGNSTEEYFRWPNTRLYGLWFNSPSNIYIVGDGAYVYENKLLKTIELPTNNFLTSVKGTGLNDVYISSSGALIFHFNGLTWQEMNDGVNGSYEGMDVKGNTVALVGYNVVGGIVGNAVITVGKHY
jgi:drug/metabolite transporter superfamily protein YnfA